MKLRHYETFYLLHPDLSDEERSAISEKLQQVIISGHGEIVKIDPWPLQKLAYRVQKQAQGYYGLDEGVMKFVTTKTSNEFDAEALAKARDESAPPAEAETEAETVEEALDDTQSTEKREEK
jgi:small subunit ribosomal protein S6